MRPRLPAQLHSADQYHESHHPLPVLLAILVGTSIGDWLGGFFGSFVAALTSIPVAGALQVVARELWQATA